MKKFGYILLTAFSLAIPLGLSLTGGCSKLLTQPNYGFHTSTPTPPFTGTPTKTGTPTHTYSPTITQTPTFTITPGGPTFTPTETPTSTNTGTPTSSPTTVPGWVFNSSAAVSGWYYNQSGSVGGGVTTAGTVGFDPSPSCPPSMGALGVTINFTGVGQQINIQHNLGSSTDFSGKTISMVISTTVLMGFTSGGPQGGYLYVQDGSAQSYASYYAPAWTNLSASCVTLTMTVPSSISGSFDPTQVQLVGFQINSNGSVASPQLTVDVFSWLYN